ncbi:MAG: iron ABC transporter permease [Pseudomonadota bacterium]
MTASLKPLSRAYQGRVWLLLFALLGVGVLFLVHIAFGAKTLSPGTILGAFVSFDGAEFDHVIIRDLRLPRALVAMAVGASLGVAGALMQGVTRNPLAEPGLLGLLAGASFAVVFWVSFLGQPIGFDLPLVAAAGALGASVVVWFIAKAAPGGTTPVTLTLSGAAITAFLASLIALMHLLDEESFDELRVWLSGSLSGFDVTTLLICLPWLAIGLAIALAIGRQVTALSMGDDVALGLGVHTARLKILSLISVVMLTACAVALAGPMGFVGLVIPHAVRLVVGADYRRIVPFSAIGGAGFLLVIDLIARMALRPVEISTGIVSALVGAPLFVWLVRRRT